MFSLDTVKVENKCKGVYYRADVSYYRTKRGFGFTSRLNLLKSKSCKGCKHCSWIYEVDNTEKDVILGLADIEHGKIYTLDFDNISGDYETGIIDDWSYVLKEVKL